jgi:L-lactate dehydrogenase (cytochrome)
MIYSNIEDMRQHAKKRLPRMFFDYIDGGAFGEITMKRNIEDYNRWTLEQRVMVDIDKRDISAHYLGATHAAPFMLAPVGFTGLFWPNGEVCEAYAARDAGIPMCLSTFSINSIEEVADVLTQNLALQLYVFKNRAIAEDMMKRAWSKGIKTLFLTADNDISSIRERDTRNGFRTASSMSISAMMDIASRPGWCWRMAMNGKPQLGNVKDTPGLPPSLMSQTSFLSQNLDPAMSWKDLGWLRKNWPGKIILKGVLSTKDAAQALEAGMDGIVITNHGGRQLDGARSSISVLQEIATFVDGRMDVLFDGGIRRGGQIVKALLLGADAVLLGRAAAYAVAANGREGVSHALSMLRAETDITMGLMGVCSIQELKDNRAELLRDSFKAV